MSPEGLEVSLQGAIQMLLQNLKSRVWAGRVGRQDIDLSKSTFFTVNHDSVLITQALIIFGNV